MAERYRELADEAPKAKSPYTHYLSSLVSARLAVRKDRSFRERLVRARFPQLQALEEFDISSSHVWMNSTSALRPEWASFQGTRMSSW